MPYRNIVYIKLEKRLLNDSRWWTMSDDAQLVYIKLLLLAAETYNKIPLNDIVLIRSIRSGLSSKDFARCLGEISKNFPKLKKNKHFRYFDEFDTKTNWVNPKEFPGISPGVTKVAVYKEKEKDKKKEKEKDGPHPSFEDINEVLKDEKLASSFLDHYQANGWKVGRNPMKDWKAAARNWQRRQGEFSKNGKSPVHHVAKVDLWKCFVCDKQVVESDRRGHMIAHEKETATRG